MTATVLGPAGAGSTGWGCAAHRNGAWRGLWGRAIGHQGRSSQKEGHITDRISKAFEQLGAGNTVKLDIAVPDRKWMTVERSEPGLELRIGSLLSLERIAQDSARYG